MRGRGRKRFTSCQSNSNFGAGSLSNRFGSSDLTRSDQKISLTILAAEQLFSFGFGSLHTLGECAARFNAFGIYQMDQMRRELLQVERLSERRTSSCVARDDGKSRVERHNKIQNTVFI